MVWHREPPVQRVDSVCWARVINCCWYSIVASNGFHLLKEFANSSQLMLINTAFSFWRLNRSIVVAIFFHFNFIIISKRDSLRDEEVMKSLPSTWDRFVSFTEGALMNWKRHTLCCYDIIIVSSHSRYDMKKKNTREANKEIEQSCALNVD